MRKGKVIIFSAPSGSGKTTIVKHLLEINPRLGFSISATTRPPRPKEVHSKDYYFFTPEEFQKKINNNELIEWEEVYPGKYYGTLISEVHRLWNEGKHVVFDVDVIGGINLKKYFREQALAIFIKVSSLKALRNRLEERKSDTKKSIEERIKKAEYESSFANHFDVILINDNLELAFKEAEDLVNSFIDQTSIEISR